MVTANKGLGNRSKCGVSVRDIWVKGHKKHNNFMQSNSEVLLKYAGTGLFLP